MNNSDEDLSQNQREFIDFLEIASNNDKTAQKEEVEDERKEVIHPNSLITKNISLFTKDPNYKLLAWLIAQLVILSLFILAASILKNNIVPYINSITLNILIIAI